MVDDALAECLALLGVCDGIVERALRQADGDGGDTQTPGIEGAECDGQALPVLPMSRSAANASS